MNLGKFLSTLPPLTEPHDEHRRQSRLTRRPDSTIPPVPHFASGVFLPQLGAAPSTGSGPLLWSPTS